MRAWTVVVGLALAFPGLSSGQDRPLLTNQQEGYQGVTPGSGNPPPRVRVGRRESRTVVTWPGFQAGAQGSRIFIQTSRPVSVQESRGPSRIVYRMQDAVISTRNNRNPLVTTQFNTPVRQAYLRRAGRDVELVIDLRADVQPSVSNAPGENGLSFVFIEFPGGNWLPDGQPPIVDPRRPMVRAGSSSSSSSEEEGVPPPPSSFDSSSPIGPNP